VIVRCIDRWGEGSFYPARDWRLLQFYRGRAGALGATRPLPLSHGPALLASPHGGVKLRYDLMLARERRGCLSRAELCIDEFAEEAFRGQ
jgi:hypothetical protein